MDKTNYVIKTYEKIAGLYTKQYFRDLTDAPYIDKFLTLLPPKARVLDVGCGPGQYTKYMLDKGYDIESIDLSLAMLEIAEKKVKKGIFKLMDMRNLSYGDNMFDGLLVAYSIIHIPSKEIVTTLKGFAKVLKEVGFILIIAQKGGKDKIVPEPLKKGEKIFINFFTKEILKDCLTKAGFVTVFQKEVKTLDTDSLSDKFIYTIAKKSHE